MTTKFDAFIGACAKAAVKSDETNKALPAEFVAAAKDLGDKVEAWGCDNHLMVEKPLPRGGKFYAATEALKADQIETGIGPQAIADLVANCGIKECYRAQAAQRVAAILCQVVGKDGAITFTDYCTNDPEKSGECISLESLYGADLWAAVQPGTEAFGIQMDRVTPDLKTILTVALLQFHVALTPRITPIQTVTQSNVQITREMMEVFDMAKPDDPPARIIELYKDPTMVSVKAQRIEPLKDNDAEGKFLVEDGVYKFQEDLNLFKLALCSNTTDLSKKNAFKPGWETFNHTDIIEDSIKVDGLLVKITKGTGESAKSEEFLLDLPVDKARLTQVPNDYRSTERRLQLDRTSIGLNEKTVTHAGTASEILAGFTEASGRYLALRVNLSASVDRKTGNAHASCWGKATIRSSAGAYQITEEDQTLLDSLTVEFEGFKLDARYNEDNKRKTSIRIEINRRNMSYELPSGRNFVMDFAIGQEGAANAAARMAQVECIGRDGNNLKIIRDTLETVHNQQLIKGNTPEANAELAAMYAAGDLVNPTAYTSSLDFGTGFLAIRSADATGDLKAFTKIRLNKIVTGLLATSFMQKQLAEGTPVTFRLVTSPFLLGTVLSCRHIFEHLDKNDQPGQGGVEYVIGLDCGARLEVVTTTFDSMINRMLIIPFFENAPTSMFNFGTDFDQGTLVGAITLGADASAAHNRMFSTTREALIPTNVVGAVLEVTGLGDVRVAMDYPGQVLKDFGLKA